MICNAYCVSDGYPVENPNKGSLQVFDGLLQQIDKGGRWKKRRRIRGACAVHKEEEVLRFVVEFLSIHVFLLPYGVHEAKSREQEAIAHRSSLSGPGN